MKAICKVFGLLAAGVWLAACADDETMNKEMPTATTLTARIETSADTRTVLDEGNRVEWTETDRIGVFGSDATQNAAFHIVSMETGGKVLFAGNLAEEEKPQVAYYPYTENASLNGNELRVEFPREYEYDGNTYGAMIGLPDKEGYFTFRQLAALLKVTILDIPAEARKLRVMMPVTGDRSISGKFKVEDITREDAVLTDCNLFASRELLLLLPEEMRTGDQTFYIPLPAGNYHEMYVELLNESGKAFWSKLVTNVSLKRATVLAMPAVETRPVVRVTSHENGATLRGLLPITTVKLKGYVDNYASFGGKVLLRTEEQREIIYDGYWNSGFLPAGNFKGVRHNFEGEVELHRGKNTYTFTSTGTDTSGREWQDSFELVLNYEMDDTPAEAVDMGTSVKWASHNMCASKPSDLGWAYCWGDNTGTDVKRADGYDKLDMGKKSIEGYDDYDAAAHCWGDKWRMPTYSEVQELFDVTTQEFVTDENGMQGYKLTAENGNTLFFPTDDIFSYPKLTGIYWTSSRYSDISQVYLDRSTSFIFCHEVLVPGTGEYVKEEKFDLVPTFMQKRLYIRPVNGSLPPNQGESVYYRE